MTQLFLEQGLNGLQFGLMLFLLAAGLTLVFGIMDMINLSHGSLYMLGAFIGASAAQISGLFWVGILAAIIGMAIIGVLLEKLLLNRLYGRDHLSQVLGTFAVILITNELVRITWGPQPLLLNPPPSLAGPIEFFGFSYPTYRLLIIVIGAVVAGLLYWLIGKTRIGMWVRAGAANREMAEACGIDVRHLFTWIFTLGAVLCGLAGVLLGPLLAVQVGMGEHILILAFVVIVIGGIGSIRGALIGSLLVGCVDTLGRALLPYLLKSITGPELASQMGPALASIMIYLVMASILFWRPAGLMPTRT